MKAGRPKKNEPREKQETLSFRIDVDTKAALEELKAALPAGVAAKQSVAIRQAILEARARLRDQK